MKRIAVLALAAVASASLALAALQPAPGSGSPARAASVDDPPPSPIDCPMCGGNAELHKRVTRIQISGQAKAFLYFLVTR
jgi:hypothetical protein